MRREGHGEGVIFFDEKGPHQMRTENVYPWRASLRAHISQLCPSRFICSPMPPVNALLQNGEVVGAWGGAGRRATRCTAGRGEGAQIS